MAHRPEVASKTIPGNADAYSIEEFCQRHSISIQLFYKNRNLMPHTFNVGTRVLISTEAAAAWRRERESVARREREGAQS